MLYFLQDLLCLTKADHDVSKEFTEKLGSLLEDSLKRFDTETQMFDEDVRHKKRRELEKNICGV
jgi:Root hair defective 3 GTP-binding protein (RHD3)